MPPAEFFANVAWNRIDRYPLDYNTMARRIKPKSHWRVISSLDRPGLAQAIGEMCVGWAALEFELFRLFYYASGLPTSIARSIFYSQTSNQARINLLHSTYMPLLIRKDKPLAASRKLKRFLDALGPLANKRNRYVHDPYACDDADLRSIVQYNLKQKSAHGQIQLVKTKDITALTRKIETAANRANRLREELIALFEASRKKLLSNRDLTLLWPD
jgi:hypothetical protein